MTHPLGHYVSAPHGTKDARILNEIESKCGSYLEKLSPDQKTLWLIMLATEVVELEINVEFCSDKPILVLKSIFDLSRGCKFDLAVAVLESLRQSVLAENSGLRC